MNEVKNVVVEVMRDEDGCVSVSKCGVSEYMWLGYVMSEGGFSGCGGDEIGGLFDGYKEREEEGGFVGEDVVWDDVKKEFMELVNGCIDDDVSYVGWSEFGVECDGSLVVMICKM